MIQITSRLNLMRPIKERIKIKMTGQFIKILENTSTSNEDFNIINAATDIIPITALWIPCITA